MFQSCFWLKLTCMRLQHWDSKRDCCNECTVPSVLFSYSSLHTTCFWGHVTGTIIGLSSCKRHIDVVLDQTWQKSVCYALTNCIKQRSPFSNSMASASASTPLTQVSLSISLDLTGWKNRVIGRAMNAGRRWRGKHCFTSRGEQIIRGYPKTITFLNIPGIYFSGKMPLALH